MGASPKLALEIAQKVESRVYEGISTKKVLQLIFRFMRQEKPVVEHLYDLRRGLSLMSSQPEFETFIRTILANHGFSVSPNRILKGRCVEHEVDAIATKDGVTYLVEIKHHQSYHALTGLDESRIARAVLEDVTEGYQARLKELRIDQAMIVTNTRYSEHAIKYGQCRGITQIGWNIPEKQGLENLIEEKKLYPISCLRGISNQDRFSLLESGIVLIKQILSETPSELVRKTGIKRETIREIVEKAEHGANAFRIR